MKKQYSDQKRKEMVLQLYMSNYSVDRIASELGFDSSDEVKDIIDAILKEHDNESIEARRKIMLARINEIHKQYWPKALGKNKTLPKDQLDATKIILQLIDQKRKLLALDKDPRLEAKNKEQERITVIWDVYAPLEKQIDKWDKKMKAVIREVRNKGGLRS